MIETIENGRRQTWTAANVAALMFVLLAASSFGAALILGLSLNMGSAPLKNPVNGVLSLLLAFGLWRRSKTAYWLGILLSALYALQIPLVLPMAFRILSFMVRHPIRADDVFFVSILSGGFSMLIAFIALLSKSARREFGIGRFAAPKAAS